MVYVIWKSKDETALKVNKEKFRFELTLYSSDKGVTVRRSIKIF